MAKTIFLILSIFFLAHAQEPAEEFHDVDVLKNLTEGGNKKISEILDIMAGISKYYSNVTAERFECLEWECVVQQENVNKSTTNAVIKGLLKSKSFKSFQCISNESRETLDKLDAKCSSLSQDSKRVLENGVSVVAPYKLLMSGFEKYVRDLYETAEKELGNATKEDAKKKILVEVEKKMKFLLTILEQIDAQIQTLKHNFFEIYVEFAYATENLLKKISREGVQKILKCVA